MEKCPRCGAAVYENEGCTKCETGINSKKMEMEIDTSLYATTQSNFFRIWGLFFLIVFIAHAIYIFIKLGDYLPIDWIVHSFIAITNIGFMGVFFGIESYIKKLNYEKKALEQAETTRRAKE